MISHIRVNVTVDTRIYGQSLQLSRKREDKNVALSFTV